MTDYTSDTPTKQCSKCEQHKPATREYFFASKWGDGLTARCKACISEDNAAYRAANPEAVKRRKKEDYQRNRDKYLANSKEYQKQNKDQVNERARKRWAKNPEKYSAQKKKRRLEDGGKRARRQREYYLENKEKVDAYQRWYRTQNPDKIAAIRHNYEARRENLPNTLTDKQWQNCLEHFGGRCAVCGRPPGLFHSLSLDHWIPVTSPDCPGTVVENCVPLCFGEGGCNNSKQSRNALEWAIMKFGERKGKKIVKEILAYFDAISVEGG